MAPRSRKQATKMPQPFRFMDLPAELRDVVYSQAFSAAPEIDMVEIYETTWGTLVGNGAGCDLTTALRQPAITRACRKIRHESLDVFYQHMVVKTELISRYARLRDQGLDTYAYKWLSTIGPENRAALRNCLVVPYANMQAFESAVTSMLQHYGITDIVDFERVEGFHIPSPVSEPNFVEDEISTHNRSDWVRISFAPAEASGVE